MYLLIDNYDSFTYNLADLVAETGRDVRVYRCDQISPAEIATLKPQGLIISPGPKRPEDAVHSLSIVRAFCHTLPILGVCLGMQILAYAAGAVVTRRFTIVAGASFGGCRKPSRSRAIIRWWSKRKRCLPLMP